MIGGPTGRWRRDRPLRRSGSGAGSVRYTIAFDRCLVRGLVQEAAESLPAALGGASAEELFRFERRQLLGDGDVDELVQARPLCGRQALGRFLQRRLQPQGIIGFAHPILLEASSGRMTWMAIRS